MTKDSTAPAEAGHGRWRRLLPAALLVALLVAFFATGLQHEVTFANLRTHHRELQAFVAGHALAAALIYLAVYTLVTAASLPVATLVTLVGGFLFGVVAGTALTVVGATLGATAIFLVARHACGQALLERARPWLGRMEAGFRRNEFSYMLFLRLMPVFPFVAVNIAPAFLGVRTRTYVMTTFLGIIPGTVVYNFVGSGLGAVFERGDTFTLSAVVGPEILVGFAGLALLALAPVALRRLRRCPADSGRSLD